MIVSIMQPYFFPYIGYFQLIQASNIFVVFDDVQYIQRGWVNRNRILGETEPRWLTFPVVHDSQKLAINERRYVDDRFAAGNRVLAKLNARYSTAPHFSETIALIEKILRFPETNVGEFNTKLIHEMCRVLEINTPIESSSRLRKDRMKGEQGIVHLCQQLGADHYLNAIGGIVLYSRDYFAANGISLNFIRPEPEVYSQFGNSFQANLSIIDVLMFNDRNVVQRMLRQYRVVSG